MHGRENQAEYKENISIRPMFKLWSSYKTNTTRNKQQQQQQQLQQPNK